VETAPPATLKSKADSLPKDTAETETGMAEKSSPGTGQIEGKNLVWFGEIERKLAELSMPTFTYPVLPLNFFMAQTSQDYRYI
jgi:hypothetical protein